jgi:hypothetical protein
MTNEERDIQRKLKVLQHAEKIGNVRRLCGNCVEDGAQAHFLRSAGIQGGIVFQLPYWVMEAGEGKSRHILTYRCKIEGE